MENIIVLTALYILLIALLYAPKCPTQTATETAPIDYFPEVEETDAVPHEPLPVKVSEPIKPDTETANTAIAPAQSPDLATMTIRQLKAMAKGKIKNYSNLTKAQLIQRLAIA